MHFIKNISSTLSYAKVREFLEELFANAIAKYGRATREIIYGHINIAEDELLKLETGFPNTPVTLITDPYLRTVKDWSLLNKLIKQMGIVGLYFFIQVADDGSWNILRIGESADLVARIQQYRELSGRSGPKNFVEFI